MRTNESVVMLRPLQDGAVKRMEVREDTYLILHSLATFGIAKIDRRENLRLIQSVLGDAIEIDKPVQLDWPLMSTIWIVKSKSKVIMLDAKVRRASAANFCYAVSMTISETPNQT